MKMVRATALVVLLAILSPCCAGAQQSTDGTTIQQPTYAPGGVGTVKKRKSPNTNRTFDANVFRPTDQSRPQSPDVPTSLGAARTNIR
jgi:hypothetical protein